MAQTFSNEQVADTFRQLNTKQKLRVSSRTGIWASWIAIILMATIFLFVALYLIDADRKAEEVQLQQSTELLVQNVESRLLSDSELLQRTGLRLMQLPGNPHRLASTDMAAASFLQDRREVLELWLVNRNYQILGAWTSTSSPEEHNVPQSHTMELPSRRALVDSVFFRDAPLVGEPYSRAHHSSLYVDKSALEAVKAATTISSAEADVAAAAAAAKKTGERSALTGALKIEDEPCVVMMSATGLIARTTPSAMDVFNVRSTSDERLRDDQITTIFETSTRATYGDRKSVV